MGDFPLEYFVKEIKLIRALVRGFSEFYGGCNFDLFFGL